MKRLAAILLVSALSAACGNFEAQSIVLDLRVLGMTANPPEIVSPVDPDDPMNIELVPVEICALVADPNASRRLAYNMVVCPPTEDGRCSDPDAAFLEIGFGTVDDPEEAGAPVSLCGTIPANPVLLGPIIEESISLDALAGFGGIELQVEFFARPEAGTLDDAAFAAKGVLYAPQIPDARVANSNPFLDRIAAKINGGDEFDLPIGRCADVTPVEMTVGQVLQLEPIEPDGVREDYVVPTFDGEAREFTENLRYAWYATFGNWQREESGGPRDFAGNEPPLDSTWSAVFGEDVEDIVGTGLNVEMWIIQRDERLGQAWYQSCVHVSPQ